MNTYIFKTVKETTIVGGSMMTQENKVPIDDLGNVPIDYLHKNRVIKGEQLLVFDTEQEYNDYINNVTL